MHVVLSDAALEDLREIWGYLATRSEAAANSTVEGVLDAVAKWSAYPERGMVVPNVPAPEVRRLVFRDWLILFQVGNASVEVLRVVHGRRDRRALRLRR